MTLNTENVLAVADLIERHEKNFSMRHLFHYCGTPCCIAGYAAARSMEVKKFNRRLRDFPHHIYEAAVRHFGWDPVKDYSIAASLFMPVEPLVAHYKSHKGQVDYISPRFAVDVLRHLAETGKVNWQRHKPKRIKLWSGSYVEEDEWKSRQK